MAIRVLWLIKGLGPGGAETLLAAAAEAHDPAEFRVECAFVVPTKDHLVDRLERAGVRCHCLSHRVGDPLWPMRLAALVRSGEYDIVHVHSPLPGAVARLLVRSVRTARRPAVVTTEHNAWATFHPLTRWANRVTIGADAAVIAVSDEAGRSVSGRAARRVTVVRHGIDTSAVAAHGVERDDVRGELGIDPGAVVIGTVANFREQKDHPNLLAAVALLRERGLRPRVVVVGQGPLEQSTRDLATSLGLDDLVIFTGHRADAARVMASFDVFVLPSLWEGLPVALMEALAAGLPVAATAVGGVAETLTDGVDALLVPPSDPSALADALARLIEDTSLRQRLAAASAARAPEFDVRRSTSAVESIYRSVARRGGEPSPEPAQRPPTSSRRVSGPQPVEIRPATPSDEAEILALCGRTLGWDDDPRAADLFRWKHVLNPAGPSPMWVAVDDGRIVGLRAFMRWTLVRAGEQLCAVRAVDTTTDTSHRGRGLFTALTMRGVDEMLADGVDFVFNTPNDQSLPGYLKMGWRPVGTLPAAVRLRRPGSAITLLGARVPAELWSEPIEVGVTIDEWLSSHSVDTADRDSGARTIRTAVDDAHLRWRFGLPALHYRVVEDEAATVVVRLRRRGRAMELVQASTLVGTRRDADRLTATTLSSTGADHALRLGGAGTGFVPLPGGGPLLTWRSLAMAGCPPLPCWSLSMSDIELF